MKNTLISPKSREESTLVVAESKCFAEFDQWMDEHLEQLVAQWIHTAAPNASRPRNVRSSENR